MHSRILILIFSSVIFTGSILYSQDIKPVRGGNLSPVVINVKDLPQHQEGDYSLPLREISEGEPPYAPQEPAPFASSLSNVTVDKLKTSEFTAPVLGTGFEA